MSRARPVIINGVEHWFDTRRNNQKARADQLELLAVVEEIDLDDLLDENLSQGDVLLRIRKALGSDNIPENIEERRLEARRERQKQPECRLCGAIGNSTRHHFVNRWIMKELSIYNTFAPKRLCTIPVCIECHRDLHSRSNGPNHIFDVLTDDEKKTATILLDSLRREHQKIFDLLSEGDDAVYEACLIRDWIRGEFD